MRGAPAATAATDRRRCSSSSPTRRPTSRRRSGCGRAHVHGRWSVSGALLTGSRPLPVVRRGSRAQQVKLSFRQHPLWGLFHVYHLRDNMRALGMRAQGLDASEQVAWADYLLRVGDGADPATPPPGRPIQRYARPASRAGRFLLHRNVRPRGLRQPRSRVLSVSPGRVRFHGRRPTEQGERCGTEGVSRHRRAPRRRLAGAERPGRAGRLHPRLPGADRLPRGRLRRHRRAEGRPGEGHLQGRGHPPGRRRGPELQDRRRRQGRRRRLRQGRRGREPDRTERNRDAARL